METQENIAVLEVKDKIGERQAKAKLAAALAKAQGEFKPVAKNRAVQIKMREGGTYRFEYADLEQLISATRPALAANGLAVVQRITEDVLTTELIHADGGVLASCCELPRMGQDIKAYGAAITYLRRYAYGALLCISADDDLDEDAEEAGPPRAEGRPAERTEPQRKAKASGDEGALASAAQVNWVKAKMDASDKVAPILEELNIMDLSKMTKADFEKAKANILGAA